MNFYTFDSKTLLRRFAFLVLLFFIGYNVVLDLSLQWYVDKKTNKNSFIEEKVSKAKHMRLQHHTDRLDTVFIGSSRTIYHISTEQFRKEGIEIYNYGSSDRGLVDYPYMVKEAISMQPGKIAISIEISALYDGNIGNYKQLTLEDLKYVFRFQNISEWGEALWQYILGKHLLFQHSEPINIRLSQRYHTFDPKIQKRNSKPKEDKEPKQRTNLQADCRIFDLNHLSQQKTVAKCTNGDGVLFGNTINDVDRTRTFNQPDEIYIARLNALFDEIKENKIIPVLILEPVFRQKYKYDIDMIRNKVHAKVIDLTQMYIADENWADVKHLNIKGRKIYTDKLIGILKNKVLNND